MKRKNEREKVLTLQANIGHTGGGWQKDEAIYPGDGYGYFNHYEGYEDYNSPPPPEEMVLNYINELVTFLLKNNDLNIELELNLAFCDFYPLMFESLKRLSGEKFGFPTFVYILQIDSGKTLAEVYDWIDGIPKLRKLEMSPTFVDFQLDVPLSVAISNPSIVELNLRHVPYELQQISLKNLVSLKTIRLEFSTVKAMMMTSLPENLECLSLNVSFGFDYSIKLPIHLKKLEVKEKSLKCFDQVSNLKELHELDVVVLRAPGIEELKLKTVFQNIPSQIRILFLRSDLPGLFPRGKQLNSISELSFTHLSKLQELDVGYHCSDPTFKLSFPALKTLRIAIHGTRLTGQFSSTLRVLELRYLHKGTPFVKFWEQFILPLKNLVSFTAESMAYENADAHVTDLRDFLFPDNLRFFKVDLQRVVVNSIPNTIKYLCFSSLSSSSLIEVDITKGESIESLKKKINGVGHHKIGELGSFFKKEQYISSSMQI
ncbi:unnamed protein product [Ambrosiozyma monospora]|uniref:Unnamed protein product n=1 Tax=Ambrosiozyma monospora TaxID=43982 RepID=A0ACB5T970_AMBMO|nr:unnamed protein product [Ambrosiozyma monospora]